jgi:hypothetical protein
MMAERIVVAGSVAQRPGRGGLTWVFLQYVLGFRRLGFDVLFLDEIDPQVCVDAAGESCKLEDSVNLEYLLAVMKQFDLSESFALVSDGGSNFIGLPRSEVTERVKSSIFFLNVMGFFGEPEILGNARRKVFLDIDPGYGQLWCELKLHDPFQGHDDFLTVGESIGEPECRIPTCGLDWITTPQPVVLDLWPARPGSGGRFTTIAKWRGPYGPLEYDGRTYGSRVHEFRKFVELPRLTGAEFELALDIDPAETKDLRLLAENRWTLVDPDAAAGDTSAYCRYIQGSGAEFMVAKNIYVEGNTGWFSDRSICYLATGRPVLGQDTGFTRNYPTGEGLLAFSTLEEAVAGVEEIQSDYARHSVAARSLAEEYFDSDRVLGRLVEKFGGD